VLATEPLVYWASLWLSVSVKCLFVYIVAGGLCIFLLRHRPAWRATIWLLTLGSFAWLAVLEWAAGTPPSGMSLARELSGLPLVPAANLYAVASLVLLGLVVHSAIRLRLLRSYALPLDIHLATPPFTGASGPQRQSIETYMSHLLHEVALCSSGQVAVPTSFGVLNPAIVIPAAPPGAVYRQFARAAVVHEFIAVLRFDALWVLLARLVQCAFFVHPVVWLAFRHYCLAREKVCDCWTVRTTRDAAEYESYLLALHRAARRTGLMWLDTPMTRASDRATRRRITDLQQDDRLESVSIYSVVAVLVAWMLMLAVLAGVDRPMFWTEAGLIWHAPPILIGVTTAVVAGVALIVIALVARARRPRFLPPVEGLAARSRQTLTECMHWLSREWQDVSFVVSLSARRLGPLLFLVLLLALTLTLWRLAGSSDPVDVFDRLGSGEALPYEPRWR
jgi:hypothetical protein